MIAAAPGGPSEWWKTALEFDDEGNKNENENEEQEQNDTTDANVVAVAATSDTIDCLRMRSSRLEILSYLLKSNIAFEEEREQLKREREQQKLLDGNDEKEAPVAAEYDEEKDDDSDDSDSDEDIVNNNDGDDETKHTSLCLVLLREIQSFGAKAVLRVVAQAMASFWMAQRSYLGYYDNNNNNHNTTLLDGDHLSLW